MGRNYAIKIEAGGRVKVIKLENPEKLADLQLLVGGRIEMIRMNRLVGILNEDGKSLGLGKNEIASELFKDELIEDDYIAGDLILVLHGEEDIRLFDMADAKRTADLIRCLG